MEIEILPDTPPQPPAPPPPYERRALLEHLIGRCRQALDDCFSADLTHYELLYRIKIYGMGERLVKASLLLSDALEDKGRSSVHRIVVGHEPDPPFAFPLYPPGKRSWTAKDIEEVSARMDEQAAQARAKREPNFGLQDTPSLRPKPPADPNAPRKKAARDCRTIEELEAFWASQKEEKEE